jgi:hypothetical protein
MNLFLIDHSGHSHRGLCAGVVVDVLNVKHLKTDLPPAFSGYYDEEKYRKSPRNTSKKTRGSG